MGDRNHLDCDDGLTVYGNTGSRGDPLGTGFNGDFSMDFQISPRDAIPSTEAFTTST